MEQKQMMCYIGINRFICCGELCC
uniref:Uncharacterized protein n=1 Tax=Arundo donax TaxID=35708 RepID=A0A0A8YDA6_ARUDO